MCIGCALPASFYIFMLHNVGNTLQECNGIYIYNAKFFASHYGCIVLDSGWVHVSEGAV